VRKQQAVFLLKFFCCAHTDSVTQCASFVTIINLRALSGMPAITTTATASSHVSNSPYPITVTTGSLSASDYGFNFVNGTLTVTPSPLTIMANNTMKAYGVPLPVLSASYSGLVNGDSAASLTTPPTLATTAAASSHVLPGGYAIIASGASDPDYTISYQPGTLLVTPASLVIMANSASKMYGAPLPALPASYTGFVNGDGPASLATRPSMTTTATSASPVLPGGYAIMASGASDPDYAISYRPGTLLITPAPLTITANSASMFQGTTVPPLSVSYSGFVNGDSPASLVTKPTVATPATPLSPAGYYPIVAGGASSPNYAINYANGVLVVTPAPVRVLSVSVQAVRLGKSKKTTQVIVLQFSGALNAGDAQSIGNYSLATIPSNKKQKSKAVALSQATYNPVNNTVRLVTRSALVLNPPLKLTVYAAGLLDTLGRPLDGNHDGQPGGNCMVTISKKGATIA